MKKPGTSSRWTLAVIALALLGGGGWLLARGGADTGASDRTTGVRSSAAASEVVDAASEVVDVASDTEVVVFKSPTCGCCTGWVEHMRQNGFTVRTEDVANVVEKKLELGVPPGLGSCHTAVVDGYVVEGHVPADAVRRLLTERPEAVGLAVPGMPMGSPGMEGPRTDRYAVLAFDERGETTVFARY